MKTFLLSLVLFIGGIANATTFYISPTGNDATGNGTIANPWKTLRKATSTVNTPGDIIHVNAGIYLETQTCNLAVGVSIEGDGVTSVIRSTVSADWVPLLSAASNSEGTNGNQHISNLKFDGQNLTTFWGIEIVGRKNFSIYNCTIVDFDDRGVIFAGRVDNNNAAPTTYATGNSFHDNIMTNCARYTPGYGAGCLNIGGQKDMLVYNNTISQDSRTPGNNGWPIKYWNDGYLDGCKIYNNTLNKIMNHNFLGNGCWDFAIELFNVRGLEIYNNTMNGGGVDLNYQDKGSYPFSVWIHHNLIQMPSINNFLQTAVTLEFESETVLIEDNIFDKVNIGVNYTPRPGDAVTDNTIRRNLMKNIGKGEGTGFFITFGGSGGSGLTFNNLNIYNNTMIMSSTNAPYWGIDLPNVGSGSISNINIKNNIIQGATAGGITQYSNVGTNTLNISNNDVYQNGNSNAPVFTNVPAPTNYTYANNKIGVNPLLVGSGNYTLQATSPCIDAGVNVGLPFNGSAPDIGYAEYGGASSGPTPPIVGTITQPTCALATGSVALSGLPATGTWTLTRTPGGVTTTGTGTTTTITGLATGTYTYTVNDGTATSAASANIVINAQPATPGAPTVGAITQPTCALVTGSVALSGLPATGTWTLTRTPGGTTTTGTGTTTTITGLATGTYTYTVTSAAGCISAASGNVVINMPPTAPLAPLVGTITQPTCIIPTGIVILLGLPITGTWTLTRSPGGVTTTGTGITATISGLVGGTYTYTVANATGCTSAPSANIVISALSGTPSAPAIGAITQPTCAVATGSVALSGLPAIGAWTLTMNPGGTTTTGTGTTTTITGLATGTYTYTVTNIVGCTSSASANVVINAQPPTPAVPVVGSITQPTCTVATGSVALSGLPATGTWTLTRTPGAVNITGTGTTTTVAGLNPGTYTYTVTNSAGCTSAASGNVVINAAAATPAAPAVGTITQPTCAVATGSVVLNSLPAAGTWTLTRSPGGITTTGTGTTTTITGLASGTYTYTVTNSAGCISAASGNVIINAAATPTAPIVGTITQPSCTVATGSVALTGLPATGTWTLIRNPGGITTTGTGITTTITGLASGTYTYTVTNAAGCISAASGNAVINAQPATPAAPVVGAITQPTCAVATGSVTLNGLPATGIWTLTRTPGAVNITGTGTTTTVAGLTPGIYTYTVTNAAGCTSVTSGNVVINAAATTPASPTVGTITQPTCTVATGSVTLTGLPATGTWTLIRNPGGITTTGTGTTTTITGLASGSYTYTVTNAAGCISIGSADIVINAQPAIPAAPTVGTITQPTCTVATGSVTLTGLPATGTWTLIRTPGGTITGTGTSTTINGLATGTYTFTVTNASGCVSSASANVVINGQPAIPAAPIVGAITQPTCAVATGSVTLSGLPATGTWTLTRTPGAVNITGTGTTTTVAALTPGTYTYTVTNAAGCTSVASGNIVINAAAATPPAPTVGTITQPTCAVATGSVVLNSLPATGTWTLTRTPGGIITTGTGTTTTITGLASGTYTYTVTNAAGCISVGSADIVINAQPATPAAPTVGTITQPTCAVATGSVTLTGLPATGTWTLTRTPGGTTTGTGTTTTINGLATGTYTFTVTNAGGCVSSVSASVIINGQPAIPTAPVVGTIIQPGGTVTTGSVDLSGLPATGTWTLTRTPGAVNITGTGTTITIAGLAPGTYTYTVTNAAGCISAPSGNVVINGGAPNIAPDADAGPDQTITLPTNTVIVSGSGTDADGIIVGYLWTKISGPAGSVITNPATAATSITGLVQGVYQFELRVTDNVGAFGRDTLQVTVNAAANIPPDAFAGADQTIVAPSTSTAASATVSGSGIDPDGTIVAYNWTKISGPAAGGIANPTVAASAVSGLVVGVYKFELRVTDNDGAYGRDTMQITISAPPNIPPVANAGPDRSLVLPANSTSLAGSGTDADGTIVSYEWKQISGPSNNVLFSLNAPVTYLNNLVEGTYEFELTVTDNSGAKAKDNVLVIVTSLQVPAVHSNEAILYPNPVVTTATLDIKSEKQNTKLTVMITDMLGKPVYKKDVTVTQYGIKEKIDMSNYGKGAYVITVYYENGERQTIKAIKQ